MQEEEATGARFLGCSETHGRLSFPTHTDRRAVSAGKAQLLLCCFLIALG